MYGVDNIVRDDAAKQFIFDGPIKPLGTPPGYGATSQGGKIEQFIILDRDIERYPSRVVATVRQSTNMSARRVEFKSGHPMYEHLSS